jgi:hypothetical protein
MTDKPDPATEPPTESPPQPDAAPELSVTWEPAAAEAMVTGAEPVAPQQTPPQQTAAFGQEAPSGQPAAAPQPPAAPAGPGTPPQPVVAQAPDGPPPGQQPPAAQAPGNPLAGPTGPGAPPPPVYPAQQAPRRPPHLTKTWIAAVVAAVLLIGGGVGGYFIGAADGHRDRGPGWSEQRGPQDGSPQDRGRGGMPDRGGDGPGGR